MKLSRPAHYITVDVKINYAAVRVKKRLTFKLTIVYTSVMKTVLNVKIDKEIKEGARKLSQEMGLPLSTIVNMYLRQFVRDKELHFAAPHIMNKALEKRLAVVEKDMKLGKNISPIFTTAEEAISWLRSQ